MSSGACGSPLLRRCRSWVYVVGDVVEKAARGARAVAVVHNTDTYQYSVATVHRMNCGVMWEGAHEWWGMIEDGAGHVVAAGQQNDG